MKNFLKISLLILLFGLFIFKIQTTQAMPNPWSDCNADFECATKASGMTFPLRLSNYSIRAMKGMIEITYPLDEFRDVSVRKSNKSLSGDISGVYTKYPVNKETKLKNGVILNTRGTLTKIYVMNMAAETGYYSAYCPQGMSKKEVEGIYEVLREAEEPKLEMYSDYELGDIVGEDVKYIHYKNFLIYYHSKDFSKKQIKKLANECINKGVRTQWDMDCCMTDKMFPEK